MKRILLLAAALFLSLTATCASACEHSYTGWVTKKSATCTRQGHQFKYCRKCDHWEQYCREQHYAMVNPVFVIQVQNTISINRKLK